MRNGTPHHTGLDIGEYVIGLTSAQDSAAIQGWLAQDDAAAACALKWEAYLLSIADSLPAEPPPPELLARIQSTLGHAEAPAVEPRDAAMGAPEAPATGRRGRAAWLSALRHKWLAAAVVVIVLIAVPVLALLRHTPQHPTQQLIELAPAPAAPAGD